MDEKITVWCPRCGGSKVWVSVDDYENEDGSKGNNYHCPECNFEWNDDTEL
jgi:DNA-directed RNA polymerase subunit M/transcription elongation factor TFIIS